MDDTQNPTDFDSTSTEPQVWARHLLDYVRSTEPDALDEQVIAQHFDTAMKNAYKAASNSTAAPAAEAPLKPLAAYAYGDRVEVYHHGLWIPGQVAEVNAATRLVSVDTESGPKTIQSTRSIRPLA